MQVKLHKPVDGKFGTYPADTWLEATDIEGILFVSMGPKSPNMTLRRIEKDNIKEKKE